MPRSHEGVRAAQHGGAGQQERNARDEREKETAHPEQQQPATGCLSQEQSGVFPHLSLLIGQAGRNLKTPRAALAGSIAY